MSDKVKTIVGIIGALFGIYNLAAGHFGWPSIVFNGDAVTAAVTTLWTLGFTAFTTWKNCNISPLAKELQAFKDAVKNRDVETLEKSLSTLKEVKKAVEGEVNE